MMKTVCEQNIKANLNLYGISFDIYFPLGH